MGFITDRGEFCQVRAPAVTYWRCNMPVNYLDVVPSGGRSCRSAGWGSAWLPGGLYTPVTDEQAESVLAYTWDKGIRYYDVAPLYGTARRSSASGACCSSTARRVRDLHEGRPPALPLEKCWRTRSWTVTSSAWARSPASGGEQREDLNDWYYRGVPDVRPSTTTATTPSCARSSRA